MRDVPKILDFGDMDSQKWLEYARYKPFPLSLGYRLEGMKLAREEKRLARRFDFCTATTRAEWETLEGYGVDTPSDWFPNGVDSDYFAPADEPYDPDTICFVGRMDYYPNQECMFDFCARTLPLLRAGAGRRSSSSIVGADPSPAVRKLGELPGVTVTGSVPDVRPLPAALGADGGAAQHRARHPEQDPRGDGGRRAGRHEPRRGRRRRRRRPGSTSSSRPRRGVSLTRACASSAIPPSAGASPQAGRARMLSHHAWPSSMQRLDGIIERCLSRFAQHELGAQPDRAAAPIPPAGAVTRSVGPVDHVVLANYTEIST